MSQILSKRASQASDPRIPTIVDAQSLYDRLENRDVFLVDVRAKASAHSDCIPGSVWLDTKQLYRCEKKIEGLMPMPAAFASILSASGIQPKHHVVVYDDETGVDAARLVWLLAAFGHENYSLLSGGYEAWTRAEYPTSGAHQEVVPSLYPVRDYVPGVNFEKSDMLEAITDPDIVILDTRSLPEYNGLDVRARKGGRIPGSINLSWDELIDYYDTGEILGEEVVGHLLQENGIDSRKRLVVYCQSNRRSAHTFVVLNALGYRVSTYAGSWSEWGNDSGTPVEVN